MDQGGQKAWLRLPSQGNLVACPDCDLLHRLPDLPPGGKAHCLRCGSTIAANKPDSLDRTLALTLTAAIVLIIANVTPLMTLSTMGRQASTSILGGVWEMWLQGEAATAALMTFCAVVAPSVYIGFMLTVLLALGRSPAPAWVGTLLRIAKFNQPWAMVEVMMLGLLVALTKIAALARVVPGTGIFAVGALIVFMAAVAVSFDPQEAWRRIRWVNSEAERSVEHSTSAGWERTGL